MDSYYGDLPSSPLTDFAPLEAALMKALNPFIMIFIENEGTEDAVLVIFDSSAILGSKENPYINVVGGGVLNGEHRWDAEANDGRCANGTDRDGVIDFVKSVLC